MIHIMLHFKIIYMLIISKSNYPIKRTTL